MNAGAFLVTGMLLAWAAAGAAQAQGYRHLSAVQDGSGLMSTNTVSVGGTSFRHVSAAGQPGGIFTNAGAGWANSAGFLQAVDLKRPGLDTDGDGTPDELDPDNDNDALDDGDEIDGSAFGGYAATDPLLPDTDADGMDDGREAAGMYDPLDPNHRLTILVVAADGENRSLTWIGKGGGTVNTILVGDDLDGGPPTNVLYSAAYAGGSAPWYKATNTLEWAGDTSPRRFFRVQTGP
jgi:hypothetical protein